MFSINKKQNRIEKTKHIVFSVYYKILQQNLIRKDTVLSQKQSSINYFAQNMYRMFLKEYYPIRIKILWLCNIYQLYRQKNHNFDGS